MKKNHFLVTGLAFAFALGLPSSCKKPTEGVDLIISAAFSEATVAFQFVDASSGKQVGLDNTSEKVTLVMTGEDKGVIVNNASGTSLTCKNGFVTLALKKGVIPSTGSPINFSLEASAAGYVSSSVNVEITEKGAQFYKVKLVKITDTPDGIAAGQSTALTSNSGGAVQSQLVLQTPTMSTSGEPTFSEVTIPSGTVLKDKANKNVTGQITSTLVYYNCIDEASAESFPGGNGFSGRDEMGKDVSFTVGGYVSMEMRGGGKEVKNFGSSISMRIQVPSGTKDAQGNVIQAGSEAPIWSYDEETSQWKQESTSIVTMNGTTGKLEVTFNMTHLSFWAFAWKSDVCSKGATINIKTDRARTVTASLFRADGRVIAKRTLANIVDGQKFILASVPSVDGKVILTSGATLAGSKLAELSIPSFCSGTYTVPLNNGEITEISVTANATCASKPGRIIRPNATVYAIEKGKSEWIYVGEMVDGKIKTSELTFGKTYSVAVIYGGEVFVGKSEYTVSASEYIFNEELSEDLCKLID